MSAKEFAFGVAIITVGILLAVVAEKYMPGLAPASGGTF